MSEEIVDPRILRTRRLLQEAFEKLLETKGLDDISVQDIAEEATVNRATFYDHYPDKFALLECLVASRFDELLKERKVQFDGTCTSALKAIIVALCEYVTRLRQLEPHMELAIIQVVRRIILEGLRLHPSKSGISPEMTAAAVSWAIYGSVKEWAFTRHRCSSAKIADTVMTLVSPILG